LVIQWLIINFHARVLKQNEQESEGRIQGRI
jgi:hypothetical protein